MFICCLSHSISHLRQNKLKVSVLHAVSSVVTQNSDELKVYTRSHNHIGIGLVHPQQWSRSRGRGMPEKEALKIHASDYDELEFYYHLQ